MKQFFNEVVLKTKGTGLYDFTGHTKSFVHKNKLLNGILNINILHTSYNFKSNEMLDTLCDFLFLSNSKVIHSMTFSGFPKVS